jgi:hypothetical protein
MPANMTLKKSDVDVILRELKTVDEQLVNDLRKAFRTDLKPINESVRSTIPTESPLSGFAKNVGSPPFVFGKPTASVKVNTRHKPGRAFSNIVSTRFTDRRPNAGFSILELAGSKSQGRTPQGRAMISALNSRFPTRGGLGRFVVPEWKKRGPDVERVARKILETFSAKVSRKFRDGS